MNEPPRSLSKRKILLFIAAALLFCNAIVSLLGYAIPILGLVVGITAPFVFFVAIRLLNGPPDREAGETNRFIWEAAGILALAVTPGLLLGALLH